MKKGIEVWSEWTPLGRKNHTIMVVHVKKAKGELTLTEIKDAVKESQGDDFYLLFLDLFHSPDEMQYDEDISGDIVTVYLASDLLHMTAEDFE